MPDQLSLFDYDEQGNPQPKRYIGGAPSQRHSATSRAAARLMDGKRSSLLAKLYYALLGMLPDGLTDEEGQTLLQMPGNTYRPRRVELEEVGLVRDSKLTRKTHSKRDAVVWVAVPWEEIESPEKPKKEQP